MKKVFFFSAFFLIACACNNTSKLGSSEKMPSPKSETNPDSLAENYFLIDSSAAILPKESTIKQTIAASNLPVVNLHKTISDDNQSVWLTITDLDAGQLRIRIGHSNPEANIRISRLVLPDGNMEGPFGRELLYNVSQKGNYGIVISRNNMASGSPVGDLSITIER